MSKYKKIGVFLLLVVSLIMIALNYDFSKLNVNAIPKAELENYVEQIDGIGDKSFIKLTEEGCSFESLGYEKSKIMKRHFKTNGINIRFELYILSLTFMVVGNIVAYTVLLHMRLKQAYLRMVLIEKIKQTK